MTEHEWRVVPLSEGQLLDVRPEDVLEGGLYRKCCTYRGGGGYDRFPEIARRRFGDGYQYNDQFVVQLFGCNLDCPYCYVTRAGVWGRPVRRTTDELVEAFRRSGQTVFHLMGGAPALQTGFWPELLRAIPSRNYGTVFHSDFMLTEGLYVPATLEALADCPGDALYAINIKGTTSRTWLRNTRKEVDWHLFFENWRRVQSSGVRAYVTFTDCSPGEVERFWVDIHRGRGIDVPRWREDSFIIDLVDYDATRHVDDVSWGGMT